MNNRIKKSKVVGKTKRLVALLVIFTMIATMLPTMPIKAEGTEKYPYTLFAASDKEGAITVNAGNFCVNGSVATNGTITSSGNLNINGPRLENANIEMIFIKEKLNTIYFENENVEEYPADYSHEETNINISAPMDVCGSLELKGNININTGVKALADVSLSGEVKSTNECVIYSETGNIIINSINANLNGLIYAPYGNITITAQNLNLNSVIIIADTITFNCPNVNANYSTYMAELIGTESDAGTGSEPETESQSETEPTTQPETQPGTEPTTQPETEPTTQPETQPETEPITQPDIVPATDEEILAYGIHNSETGSINIQWFTDYENGTYEIRTSDDGINYTTVASLGNETTYSYTITDDFSMRYFKVILITDSGAVAEAVPFIVRKTYSGYVTDFIDTDGDTLPDVMENIFGSDINKPDTDEDGLTDYQEVCLTGTNPAQYDSVTAGVSDTDADPDGDGLSNAWEINLGTKPNGADTDGDTLSDGDEVNIHNTDPLNADTDNDGITDWDEMQIGLDPINPQTFGVPDSEYRFVQTIEEDSVALSEINAQENPYKLSIEMNASGYVEGNLAAGESGYYKVIDNEAMLGMAVELDYSMEVENVTLKFDIEDEYTDNSLNFFPEVEELNGIKRLNVFKYFEDMNMLLPIETFHDVENNTVYTVTDELGTYCVMDMEVWLSNFEVPKEVYATETVVTPMALYEGKVDTNYEDDIVQIVDDADDTSVEEAEMIQEMPMLMSLGNATTIEDTKIDLVFFLQSTGNYEKNFLSQKNCMVTLMNNLVDKFGSGNIRICVIEWNLDGARVLKGEEEDVWFTNPNVLQQELDSVGYEKEKDKESVVDYPLKVNAFIKMDEEVEFRRDAAKFVINFMSGSFAGYCRDEIRGCGLNNINYSEVWAINYGNQYSGQNIKWMISAIESTNGIKELYTTGTQNILFDHICTYSDWGYYDVIVPTGWKTITLNGKLNASNGIDTDKDELTDWQEVATDMLSYDEEGRIILPTIKECMDCVEKPYAKEGMGRFLSGVWGGGTPPVGFEAYVDYAINHVRILPINSDPTDVDSDDDGLLDGTSIVKYENTDREKMVAPKDPEPLKYTGAKNLWANHVEQAMDGEKMATGYSGFCYGYGDVDVEKKFLWETIPYYKINMKDAFMATLSVFGSALLNFEYDDRYIALHGDAFQWQAIGGYNKLYDWIFDVATSMDKEIIEFHYDGQDYVIWAWKGNYLNMGAGAEVGFYDRNNLIKVLTGLDQWDVNINNSFPMSLSLYRDTGNGTYSTYYNWFPVMEQWWITGFVPNIRDYSIKDEELVPIASIDFSENTDMYEAVKADVELDSNYKGAKDEIFFDDECYTIWIGW